MFAFGSLPRVALLRANSHAARAFWWRLVRVGSYITEVIERCSPQFRSELKQGLAVTLIIVGALVAAIRRADRARRPGAVLRAR